MSEEEMIHCPYNYSHVILKSRMVTHLQKCRENYPMEKYTTCPFNSTHDVPVPELKYHIDTCPDRKALENYLYVMNEEQEQDLPEVVEVEAATLGENWDEEKVSGSYLEIKSKVLPESKIFKPVPAGRSKSIKKAFSQSQVKKFSEEDRKRPVIEYLEPDPHKFALPDAEPHPVASGSGIRSLGEEEEFREVVRKSKRKSTGRGLSIKETLKKEDYF